MAKKLDPKLQEELDLIANNVYSVLNGDSHTSYLQNPRFTKTATLPTFLSDLLKEHCAEKVGNVGLNGPAFDQTSDVRADGGDIYKSFKIGLHYEDDGDDIHYHPGYIAINNARLFTARTPIISELVNKYEQALDDNIVPDGKVLKQYYKNNDLNPFEVSFDDKYPNAHKTKNESIRLMGKEHEDGNFINFTKFDKITKEIDSTIKDNYTIENGNKNRNTM